MRLSSRINVLLFAGTLSFSTCALAQENKKSSERIIDARTIEKKVRLKGASSGLSAILGADFGIVKATPEDTAAYGVKSGNGLEIKILAGWLFEDFLVDLGGGFYYSKIRGKENVVENGVKINGDREVSISGVFVEGTPLFRLGDNFFAGPVTQIKLPPAFNDYYSKSPSVSVVMALGGQAGYQIFNRELNSRFTFKVLKNIGLKKWSDIAYFGGVQFGIPFRQPDSLVIRKTTVVNKLREIVEYRKKDFTITLTSNVVKLALDNILTFYIDPSGRPTLTADAQSFLVGLGASLQSNEYLWETLRIDAQTPSHINSVHDSLISVGIPSSKVKKGKSTQEVADGGNASVDLTFIGVKNTNELAEKIRTAMKSSKIPENCTKEGVCE